jgi:hypothetical protein
VTALAGRAVGVAAAVGCVGQSWVTEPDKKVEGGAEKLTGRLPLWLL